MDKNVTLPNASDTSMGSLVVQISEAESAIPVEGALALITKDETNGTRLYGALTTYENGRTPPINLPAPEAYESLDPLAKNPYETYYVRVSHPGFYTEVNHMVQIFGDSHSVLKINMIPLPEYPEKEVIRY